MSHILEMQGRKAELQAEMKKIEKRILFLPEGQLECRKNRERYQWYQNIGNRSIYIPQRERRKAQQLAERTYLQRKVHELEAEIAAIDAYCRIWQKKPQKTSADYLKKQGCRELLEPIFTEKEKAFAAWEAEEYPGNPSHPEHLNVETKWGEMVRSKSEREIFTMLRDKGIPCCYERPLKLKDGILFPDFTILHPETGEMYIWEHLGRMDQADYREKAIRRLRRYMENGWYPGINLILTAETDADPLSTRQIAVFIEMYFSR